MRSGHLKGNILAHGGLSIANAHQFIRETMTDTSMKERFKKCSDKLSILAED